MTVDLVGLRVLLAEDDELVRRVLVAAIQNWDVLVHACADGALAQTELASDVYDVLVTDLKMPGASGLELLEFVRARRLRTAVIVITGFTTPEAEDAISTAGAFLLRKPFNAEELRSALAGAKRRLAANE